MKHSILAFILLIVSLCCSCAQAPKEVMDEISAYDSAQTVETTEIKTAPFKEVTDNAKDINKTNNTNIKIQNIILPESEGMPTYSIKLDSSGRKELFDALSDCDELGLHDGVTVESSGGVYYNYELICFVIGSNTHKEKLNKGAEMIISA